MARNDMRASGQPCVVVDPKARLETPQGSVISPLLANIHLHYVFDLWVDAWRKKCAQGEVMVSLADYEQIERMYKLSVLAECQWLLKELGCNDRPVPVQLGSDILYIKMRPSIIACRAGK
jgi:hypothetical protein